MLEVHGYDLQHVPSSLDFVLEHHFGELLPMLLVEELLLILLCFYVVFLELLLVGLLIGLGMISLIFLQMDHWNDSDLLTINIVYAAYVQV